MKERLVVITGTTAGLGKGLFDALKDSCDIITVNRRMPEDRAHINICADLSDVETVKRCGLEKMLSVRTGYGSYVFINNAFTMGSLTDACELDADDVVDSVNVNVTSAILLLNGFVRSVRGKAQDVRVVNITSGAARRSLHGWSLYCTAKAAMEMYVNCLGNDCSDIKCFNIDPGVVDTDMQAKIRDFKDGREHDVFDSLAREGRLKTPDQAAEMIIRECL
ncbi:SDR family NAD(P)-dependent oxidoreductase [Seleniivibrio sp.]|uniref:SDR family NAD(P)-dependent oxidoreductase n=1 Tax=Seleniivibrio sp. TaxID=2898801 RepID=UPI0025ED79E9|nr:SDR family NAD(P)-dependent oxidoreductase [Seleniivibrio sp.]MCD8553155.1 SDR family NAD(P)-dependent oxidoreductase [Seleniivibrio sp.]